MRRLAITILALSALTACSLVNAPDPRLLDAYAPDGGVDAWVDGNDGGDAWVDSGDGGLDAPDAFVCPSSNENCGNGHDDDCDGLADCADPDCAARQAPECCRSGLPAVTETFTINAGTWTTAASWNGPIPNAISAGNQLAEMGSGPPIGMVNVACLQVDLGLQLRFDVVASPCTGTECDGFMDVVVGPSTTFTGMLTTDLGVRAVATDGGHMTIDVMQGASSRATSRDLGTGIASVTIDLAPGVANGAPAIVGTVRVTAGMPQVTDVLVSQIYVTDRDIFGTSTCHGLRLGVQGYGTHVALDNVRIAQLDCSNPGRFDTLHDDDTIDAVSMSVSDAAGTVGWGRGGIGDPALSEGVFTSAGGAHHFTLLFDGSQVDRASDVIGHLPLSIGGADSTRLGSDGLVLDDLCTSWTPRGVTTACMPQASAAGHAVIELGRVMRDPTLYPEGRDAAAIGSYRVAWVGDPESGTGSVLYNTVLNAGAGSRITGTPTATTITGDEACRVRQPLILPLVGATDWLLLYLCEDVFPPVVHGARLAGDTATRIPDLVLGEAELGPLAAQGVIDIAGVVFVYGGVPTYRVWLTTRPSPTDTAIVYVEGTPEMDSPAGTPPTFVPFAGNPVLTETSSVFDSCGLGCQLHGITATRISNQATQVRLLVERWVDTGSGLTYGLVPLQQIWPADH